jgi:hypothetical protein
MNVSRERSAIFLSRSSLFSQCFLAAFHVAFDISAEFTAKAESNCSRSCLLQDGHAAAPFDQGK